MTRSVRTVSALLFVSGLCALVFQTAWLREFRLIFGATTPATAAVLAIFMGGLGLGNAWLGPRADAARNPLRMYAQLELAISAAAIASPFLVDLVRAIYIGLGGQESLGLAGAMAVRVVLSSLVIGVPTFLMGGTLPAASRTVTAADDNSRGDVGWLYGLNTLGAVTGALLGTFVLLEVFGTRETLWLAAGMNLLNGYFAWRLSARGQRSEVRGQGSGNKELKERRSDRATERRSDKGAAETNSPPPPLSHSPPLSTPLRRFLYAAAGIVGFAFFLMEMVWYRMLGPILGGTTFTFGLILAVALAGIGIGGILYPLLFGRRQPTWRDLALTCAWEALAIAIPFALGDRIAMLAYVFQGMRYFGFLGQTLGWTVVASIVVFPAALASGIQFPLLISLLGHGNRDVGRHVGQVFAWNTVGAILGSLVGGFGLLPLVTVAGAWKLVVVLLVALALTVLLTRYRPLARRSPQDPRAAHLAQRDGYAVTLLHPLFTAAAAAACMLALGPTAVWKHSGIGAGRARPPDMMTATRNDLQSWINDRRRNISWEADGREASVGLATGGAIAFIVGGKSDGNAATDAGTQIMFPVLAAMLHPEPRESLVIGLGTGESAGWLAALPTMERVDVVELEPAIAKVAAAAAPLNHDVLNHPKVRLAFNDAREMVQTTRRQYDLIASEPSNPYRAGVASLYTLDFYHKVQNRLKPGGLFAQWVQGYEIDVPTVRMVMATLRRAFAHVEVWETKPGDMVLICANERPTYDLARLRERLQSPGYREAVRIGWRTVTVEGVLSHYVANERFVSAAAGQDEAWLNTDNQNFLEYRFARTVGMGSRFSVFGLREEARSRSLHRPTLIETGVDWEAVEDAIVDYNATVGDAPIAPQFYAGQRGGRAQALADFFYNDGTRVIEHWESLSRPPEDMIELFALAFSYAQKGDEKARPLIQRYSVLAPTEALFLEALLAHQQDKWGDAAERLIQTLLALRGDPTVLPRLGETLLRLAVQIVEKEPRHAAQLYEALAEPFALFLFNERRQLVRCRIAQEIGSQAVAVAVSELEPHIPWDLQLLEMRLKAYEAVGSPLARRARRELADFRRWTPQAKVLVQ